MDKISLSRYCKEEHHQCVIARNYLIFCRNRRSIKTLMTSSRKIDVPFVSHGRWRKNMLKSVWHEIPYDCFMRSIAGFHLSKGGVRHFLSQTKKHKNLNDSIREQLTCFTNTAERKKICWNLDHLPFHRLKKFYKINKKSKILFMREFLNVGDKDKFWFKKNWDLPCTPNRS